MAEHNMQQKANDFLIFSDTEIKIVHFYKSKKIKVYLMFSSK